MRLGALHLHFADRARLLLRRRRLALLRHRSAQDLPLGPQLEQPLQLRPQFALHRWVREKVVQSFGAFFGIIIAHALSHYAGVAGT